MPLLMGRLKILRTLTSFILGKNGGSDIKELREFRQLKGNLSVLKLEKVVDARDASKANLRDKLQLNESVLKWGGDTNDSKKDRDVLDQLQPHAISHQSKFVIGWLPFRDDDEGVVAFSRLQQLYMQNCCNLTKGLPDKLLSLKTLVVLPDQMHTLFPSLQTLSIWCCPELESFPEETDSYLLYMFEAPMMILVAVILKALAVGILRKALLNGWPSGCTKDVLEKLVPRTNLNKLQIHNYGGTRFRCWLGYDSFCNIVSVSFQNCENFCILLPVGKLPSLKHLSIEGFDELVAVGPEFYGKNSLVAQWNGVLSELKMNYSFPLSARASLRCSFEVPRSAQSFVRSAKFIKFLKAEFHAILQASSSHKFEAFTTFHLMIIP
ncbi:uncharacterized protein LOC136065856 [Quercus suber]|uniref:uncharacterized protein LOC136065856 n=1 Tax=Quercus suber TaxID=58331 RepID=UPI0032E0096E